MKYSDYIAIERHQREKKNLDCVHEYRDDVVWLKCKCCGQLIPHRTKKDLEYRGEVSLIED